MLAAVMSLASAVMASLMRDLGHESRAEQGVSDPLATAGAAGAGAAARALVGGGGGGGLDGRVELVMVDAVFFCGAGVASAGDTVAVAVAAGDVAGAAVGP